MKPPDLQMLRSDTKPTKTDNSSQCHLFLTIRKEDNLPAMDLRPSPYPYADPLVIEPVLLCFTGQSTGHQVHRGGHLFLIISVGGEMVISVRKIYFTGLI